KSYAVPEKLEEMEARGEIEASRLDQARLSHDAQMDHVIDANNLGWAVGELRAALFTAAADEAYTGGAQTATSAVAPDLQPLVDHIVSGRDPFEGSPFYGDHPDEILEEMELLFRDSGWAVV